MPSSRDSKTQKALSAFLSGRGEAFYPSPHFHPTLRGTVGAIHFMVWVLLGQCRGSAMDATLFVSGSAAPVIPSLYIMDSAGFSCALYSTKHFVSKAMRGVGLTAMLSHVHSLPRFLHVFHTDNV